MEAPKLATRDDEGLIIIDKPRCTVIFTVGDPYAPMENATRLNKWAPFVLKNKAFLSIPPGFAPREKSPHGFPNPQDLA